MSEDEVYGLVLQEYIRTLESLDRACDMAALACSKVSHAQKRVKIENRGRIRVANAMKDHSAMKNSITSLMKKSKQTLAALEHEVDISKVNSDGRK